jgi:hypothetical protein
MDPGGGLSPTSDQTATTGPAPTQPATPAPTQPATPAPTQPGSGTQPGAQAPTQPGAGGRPVTQTSPPLRGGETQALPLLVDPEAGTPQPKIIVKNKDQRIEYWARVSLSDNEIFTSVVRLSEPNNGERSQFTLCRSGGQQPVLSSTESPFDPVRHGDVALRAMLIRDWAVKDIDVDDICVLAGKKGVADVPFSAPCILRDNCSRAI